MSRRYLIPTNMFYREADPMPPDFPQPNTGDHYYNTVSQTIRVFANGAWDDVSSGGGGDSGGGSLPPVVYEARGTSSTNNLSIASSMSAASLIPGASMSGSMPERQPCVARWRCGA